MLDLFQCPDNGAIGQTGQNAVPHVAEVYGNATGFATIRLPSTMDPDAKVLLLRKRLAIKYVLQSMENGLLGHLGLLVVRIVNSFEDVSATIQNLPMADVIVSVMILLNKIVLEAVVNVSFHIQFSSIFFFRILSKILFSLICEKSTFAGSQRGPEYLKKSGAKKLVKSNKLI